MPAIAFQSKNDSIEEVLDNAEIEYTKIGKVIDSPKLFLKNFDDSYSLDIKQLRDKWYYTSYLLDNKQTAHNLARTRFDNYKHQPLNYRFPSSFDGKKLSSTGNRPKAAVLREKGSNSEREMANAMYLAGFDVKDVHMTDLISGRETLEDIQFIGAVGGFSNSDVLGSAKGWAGAFKYNEKAKQALKDFLKDRIPYQLVFVTVASFSWSWI